MFDISVRIGIVVIVGSDIQQSSILLVLSRVSEANDFKMKIILAFPVIKNRG